MDPGLKIRIQIRILLRYTQLILSKHNLYTISMIDQYQYRCPSTCRYLISRGTYIHNNPVFVCAYPRVEFPSRLTRRPYLLSKRRHCPVERTTKEPASEVLSTETHTHTRLLCIYVHLLIQGRHLTGICIVIDL